MLLFGVPGLLDLRSGVQSGRLKLHSDRDIVGGPVLALEGVLPVSCRCCLRPIRRPGKRSFCQGRLAASELFRFPRISVVVGRRSLHSFYRAFLVAIPTGSSAHGWAVQKACRQSLTVLVSVQ